MSFNTIIDIPLAGGLYAKCTIEAPYKAVEADGKSIASITSEIVAVIDRATKRPEAADTERVTAQQRKVIDQHMAPPPRSCPPKPAKRRRRDSAEDDDVSFIPGPQANTGISRQAARHAISITLRDALGTQSVHRVDRNVPLLRIFEAYARLRGVAVKTLKFFYYAARVTPDTAPQDICIDRFRMHVRADIE